MSDTSKMVQLQLVTIPGNNSYMVYRTVLCSITLNDPENSDFKDAPLFDLNVTAKLQDIDTWLLQATNRKWYVTYCIVPSPIHFSYFCLKINVAYFSGRW